MKRIKQAFVIGAAVMAILIGGSMAEAATGQFGPHNPAEASCNTSTAPALQAHAPYIRATYVPSSNVTVGPNHHQWVGFRHWLLRWNGSTWAGTDQNADGAIDRSALFQAQVTSEEGGPWFPPSQWYNVDQKKWQPGTTFFSIKYKGYYKVRTEYIWYADSVSGSGYDVLDSVNHFVTAGWSSSADPWCQY